MYIYALVPACARVCARVYACARVCMRMYVLVFILVFPFYFPHRILLCAMCGDQYPVELILGPLLHHQSVYCNSSARPDTVILETYVGTVKRTVSITLTSYHRKSYLVIFCCEICVY